MKYLLAILLLSLNVHAQFMGNMGWDYEARRWQTNVANVTATLSDSSYKVGTDFMQSVKRWGIRTQLGRVNLYLGADTNAMVCPIIADWSGTVTNDDLVAPTGFTYTEATGMKGNGTTAYLRCSKGGGLNIGTFTNNRDIHMAVYVRTNSAEATDCMGVSAAANGTQAMAVSNGGLTYVFMGNNVTSVVDANTNGFYISTRTLTNNAVTYRNGVALVTDSADDNGSIGGTACMVHAINVDGSVVALTTRTLSYYGMGYKIVAARVNAYNIAVQNVQQALNRRTP